MIELSVLIPARNEMFLARTIEDLLFNTGEQTEIIAVLDGAWAKPPIPQHPRVNVVYLPEAIGQRAATNLACKLAKGKYVAKVDAHCAFDKDWDLKMLEGFKKVGDDVTMVPVMRNLHAFDWKCHTCNWTKYQGPTPTECPNCKTRAKVRKRMRWQPRRGVASVSYCFDSEPHFQYFNDWKARPEYQAMLPTGFTETMSLQGSCFVMTREKYWELDICHEGFGSWGNQGIEVAVKTWLSGGRVLVNHSTWYAHMFRTQGGDFGFPYPQSGKQVAKCKEKVRDLFWNNKFDKQIRPLRWLIDKFQPPGWTKEDIDKLNAN